MIISLSKYYPPKVSGYITLQTKLLFQLSLFSNILIAQNGTPPVFYQHIHKKANIV